MAEKVSDDQFKSHVMQFIEVANQKFDGLTADIRTNGFKLDRLENGVEQVAEKVNQVEEKLDRVAGQFNDVAGMAIKDHSRIDNLKGRVEVLEGEAH